MSKITEFLLQGSVTVKEVDSPINGKLTVKWDTFGGYQILGGGLWQVGGPVESVWRAAFYHLNSERKIDKVLILGLGGGTIAKLVNKKYPGAKIVGVDIDSVIVKLGEDYMGLKKFNVETHIMDAEKFLKEHKVSDMWNLICVDLYVGDNYPEKFEKTEFIKSLKKHLSKDGTLIVNRLYYGSKTKKAEKFLKLLKADFNNVKEVYPSVTENVIYIAQ